MADAPALDATTDPESPPANRIVAIANQKGGVGKTTTAINLGTALAAVGQRVLIFDLDPQGNASTGLGIEHAARNVSSYDLLLGQARLDAAIRPSPVPNLHVVPATVDLSGLELELGGARRRAFRLKDALAAGLSPGIGPGYDQILIDCPPALGLLTINAMAAADAVLVPLQCEFFALEGLTQLLRTIEHVRDSLNPGLAIEGVVLTMFDRRNRLSDQVAADVRGYLGDKVYDTVIPRNVRISEAPSHGLPALIYDHRCAGSEAYMRLAREVLRRSRAAA